MGRFFSTLQYKANKEARGWLWNKKCSYEPFAFLKIQPCDDILSSRTVANKFIPNDKIAKIAKKPEKP